MGEVFVVTGAASGIGAAVARQLRQRGDTVIGVDLAEPASGVVDEHVHMNQADLASIDAAVAGLPSGVAGLVNSAGVPPAERFPPAEVLRINFYGLREFTRRYLPEISRGGAIVNLSSAAGMGWMQNAELLGEALAIEDLDAVDEFVTRRGIHNEGMGNLAAYPISKQLLIAWTASAFPVWQETGVRMNALAPSAVATPILDDFLAAFGEVAAKRMQAIGASTPDDVAKVALILLDPDYDWINGATIPLERGAKSYGGLAELGLAG